MARRYDEAIALAGKGLELDPNFAFSLAFQGARLRGAGAVQRGPQQHAESRAERSVTRRSWRWERMSTPSQVTRREAEKLIKEVEEVAEAPLLLPLRNRHRVCEPWGPGHCLQMVSQRCGGSSRLHGLDERRAVDGSVALGSAVRANIAGRRAHARLRVRPVPELDPSWSRGTAAADWTQRGGAQLSTRLSGCSFAMTCLTIARNRPLAATSK